MGRTFLAVLAMTLVGCGEKASTLEDLNSVEVTFPDGSKIRAQAMREQSDLIRGMQFRESLPQDRGMLFFLMREVPAPFYLYQVKIPLDIIWMDHDHRIVQIAHDVPPCPSAKASECPSYGGKYPALFVLDTNAGFAAKHGLREGQVLDF